jgi:Zn-finger nucleic acid-binding protein
MKCPVDGATLVIAERSGVEIDYCPQCRGVWLDRGELDKIIDRSAAMAPPPPPSQQTYGEEPRKKRRGGFLEELFDF